MKKIIIIIAAAIPLTVLIIFLFLFIKSKINYHYIEEPFDQYLSHYEHKIKYTLLKRLGYKPIHRTIEYNRKLYNLIILDYYTDFYDYNYDDYEDKLNDQKIFSIIARNKFFDKWNKWLTKDKRLIVFFNSKTRERNLNTFFGHYLNWGMYNSYYSKVDIKKSDSKFLKDVSSLYINTNSYISLQDLQKIGEDIKPILKQGEKIYIARIKAKNKDLIFLSDKTIFSDKSILQMDNTIFLNNLLIDYFDDTIVFDDVHNYNDFRDLTDTDSTPFFLIGAFKFISLQLLLLAVIFFLIFIKRFGKPVDMLEFKNRSLSSHLNAVGYFFEKTNNEKILKNILDDYFIFQLKQALKYFSSENIFKEIDKRYDLSAEEQDLFNFERKRTKKELVELQVRRYKFLKKIREG